jgi:hypothetical protein
MFIAVFVVSISWNLTAFVIIGRTPTRATGVWLFSEIGPIGNLLLGVCEARRVQDRVDRRPTH